MSEIQCHETAMQLLLKKCLSNSNSVKLLHDIRIFLLQGDKGSQGEKVVNYKLILKGPLFRKI